ncbi:MAG: amidohydrolase [Rhodobacteraceae bacterium]|nr:MAG: amidohydrolase [Paracoccaceae bacterium]
MFQSWYSGQKAQTLALLSDLHRHPETGFEERRTAGIVVAHLRRLGLEVAECIGGTGVVGRLVGQGQPNGTPRRIAIRAELDALPMQEASGLDYSSTIDGRFHGCGHDGHTVTALTAASYLAAHPDFAGEAIFIFQPAEELLRGARAMLADGLFDRFPCDEVYALHNLPGLQPGHVGVPDGAALASSDDLDVTISGAGTHGSAPHTGADTVLAAASFMTQLQQAATRVTDARAAAVISFGKITGGTARNILPGSVRLEGTMRCGDQVARARLGKLMQDAARAVELVHCVRVEMQITPVAPVAVNASLCRDAILASAMKLLGAEKVVPHAQHLMASEDFAEFQTRIPGGYFFVGQDGPYPHHPNYRFDPDIIPIGAEIFVDLVRTRTAHPHRFNNQKAQ